MATIGALPPPPGVNADFVDPPNQTGSTTALHANCLTLITFCVVIRIYTRHFINHKLGWDDCKIFSNPIWAMMHISDRLLSVRLRKPIHCLFNSIRNPTRVSGPYDRVLGPVALEYVCPLRLQPDARGVLLTQL